MAGYAIRQLTTGTGLSHSSKPTAKIKELTNDRIMTILLISNIAKV